MSVKFLRNNILLLILICLLYGCFKEDSPIAPVNRNGIKIKTSLYFYQTFYDLSRDTFSTNPNGLWDLAFECSMEGWHIRINFSNFMGIYRTGSSDFNATSYAINDSSWIYDASSGNPDSTAIGNWKDTDSEGPQVFLLGNYDGIRYKPIKKLKFNEVTDTSYSFTTANIDNSDISEVVIKKEPAYNFTYYSLSKKATVTVEPPKDNWDLLFTQYTTTLFTDDGIPTPYIVRGVYVNPWHVEAMLDTMHLYPDISAQHIVPSQMSTIQDIIGYNWKSVEINQSANTARYAVRKNYSYIIRDTEGEYYKFRFLSFVNDSLLVGYPTFEKAKL